MYSISSRPSFGTTVRIVNRGVPPFGCQTEWVVRVCRQHGHLDVFVTQGWVTGNTRQAAEREARRLGLSEYVDETGKRVPVVQEV